MIVVINDQGQVVPVLSCLHEQLLQCKGLVACLQV